MKKILIYLTALVISLQISVCVAENSNKSNVRSLSQNKKLDTQKSLPLANNAPNNLASKNNKYNESAKKKIANSDLAEDSVDIKDSSSWDEMADESSVNNKERR